MIDIVACIIFLLCIIVYSAMVMVSAHVVPRPVYDLVFMTIMRTPTWHRCLYLGEVCEPDIPSDPLVERLNLVEVENDYLK